jgi:phenylalanyl-tRNA synthetase alpha chain
MRKIEKLLGSHFTQILLAKIKNLKNNNEASKLLAEYLGKRGLLVKNINEKNLDRKENKYIREHIRKLVRNQIEYLDNNEDLSFAVPRKQGKSHILMDFLEKVSSIAKNLGFEQVEHPEITNEFFNFDSLGILPEHPSRDRQQTFYFEKNKLLRTHTSAVQNHVISNKIPNTYSLGAVFRRDEDNTHTPLFHQLEFVALGKHRNLRDLFDHIETFLGYLFEEKKKIRFRPSYFPFTNLSYEVDVWHNGSWLEILGCGMISPAVFQAANTEYQTGWAMGCGIERLIMLTQNLHDIRKFYLS